jgi:deazaflavin-dependent oxidoreductase (nitroreductase family)
MGSELTPEELAKRKEALSHPVVPKVIKVMARAQVAVFKATGGRIGSKWRIGAGFRKPVPTLLLEHVGRRSGETYTTPLLYMVDGADLVVVASQGGLPRNPQWFHNLRGAPRNPGVAAQGGAAGPGPGSPTPTSGRRSGPGWSACTPTSRSTSRPPTVRSPW